MVLEQVVEKWCAKRRELLTLAKCVHTRLNDEEPNAEINKLEKELDNLKKEYKQEIEQRLNASRELARGLLFSGKAKSHGKALLRKKDDLREKMDTLSKHLDLRKSERDKLYDAVTTLTDEETMALVLEVLEKNKSQLKLGDVGYEAALNHSPYFQRKFSAYNKNKRGFMGQLNRALSQLEIEGQIENRSGIIQLRESVPQKFLLSYIAIDDLALELYPALAEAVCSSADAIPLQELAHKISEQYHIDYRVIPAVLHILCRANLLCARTDAVVTYGEYQEKKCDRILYIEKGQRTLDDIQRRRVGQLITILRNLQNMSSKEEGQPTINTIDNMEGLQFEHFCAGLLRKLGFVDVEVTKGSGDQGVDIIAVKDHIRYAVQCKRYASSLNNTPVQEVNAGRQLYQCHVGVVLTNQYFTAGAKELAATTGVLLWDRDELVRMIEQAAGKNEMR